MPSVPSRIALATSEASARVGRGFSIMLSSICVAVITTLPAAVRHLDDALLEGRHLFRRQLHAEVAARHHHPVRSLEDRGRSSTASRFSILAMTGVVAAAGRMSALHLLDVRGPAHERERDVVDAVPQAEGEVAAVLLREGRRRERDAGQVHALVRLQQPAVHDDALHLAPRTPDHLQLEVAVVEQDAVARRDVARQRVVRGRDALGVPSIVSSVVMRDARAVSSDRRRRP